MLRFKNNNTFICAFLTACYTGMRTGEVFALTWDDIDFENKIIKINKTVYAKIKDDKGRWYLGTTKTKGSCREVFAAPKSAPAGSEPGSRQSERRRRSGFPGPWQGFGPVRTGAGGS